jgi:hypothetical protein
VARAVSREEADARAGGPLADDDGRRELGPRLLGAEPGQGCVSERGSGGRDAPGRVHLCNGSRSAEAGEAAASDDDSKHCARHGERRGRAQHRERARPLPTLDSEDMSGCVVGSGCGVEEEARMGMPRGLAITSPKWINAILKRLSASALYHSLQGHYLCIISDIFDHVLLIFILQQVLQAKKKERITGPAFASAFEEPKPNASSTSDSIPSLFVLPSTVQP